MSEGVADKRASSVMQSPFEMFGALYLPEPDQASSGTAMPVIEADERWQTSKDAFRAQRAAVWGRMPLRAGRTNRLLVYAIRREISLARMRLRGEHRGLRVARVHRLPPAGRPGWLRSVTRMFLMSGVAVELGLRERRNALDAVVAASGIRQTLVRLRPSGDGSALARAEVGDGTPVYLRVARLRGLRDLTRNASALLVLEAENLEATPRLIGEGVVSGTAWTLETAMAGQSVRRPSPKIVAAAARFAARFPRSGDLAQAPISAATDLASAFRRHSHALNDLALGVQARTAQLGSILEHGDYWIGNLLLEDERITGVVDWDRWHLSGVPGTDVLHLYASTQRRPGRDVGDLFLDRIWEDTPFARLLELYCEALGIEPTKAEREAIAVAWWLRQMAAALRLGRRPATDPMWVRRNIDAVLERLTAPVPTRI